MKAESKSSPSVGLILQTSLLGLTLSSAITLGIVLTSAWHDLSWARHVQAVAAFDRITYETTMASRLVRAKVLGAYYSGENTSAKFKKIHHDHDAMIAHALASMNPALIPGAGDRVVAIRDAWTNTQEPWASIETLDPGAPKATRDKAVARWFDSATAVVNRFVDLSRMETGEIRLTDPAIGELVTARQIGFAIREIHGNECLIMRPHVVGGEPITPRTLAQVGDLRGDAVMALRILDDLLARPRAPAELLKAVATAKEIAATGNAARDAIYQRIGSGGPLLSSDQWTGVCVTQVIPALMNIGDTALDLVERHAEITERKAAQRLVVVIMGLIGVVVVSGVALLLVQRRVMRPVTLLTEVIRHLSRRDYSVPVPQFRQRDEFGGMAITLEALRLGVLEAERAAAERQHSQKLEALGTLAGGIAHDLNNTLVPVLSLAKLTGRRLPEGSRERANLDTILNAGFRASDLVRQILAFARKEQVEKQPVDLTALTRETLKLLHASVPATIRLIEDIDEVAPVLGNPGQLHQVIINVVTNGAQAIDGKIGQITVSLKRDGATGNKLVRLTVLDTGVGMDEEMLSRIFDPFFTTKPVGEGTGLGLSVVHGIITDHGGRIEVTSRAGQGSQFHIYLPALNTSFRAHPAEERALKAG
jgi:signal transduction histidine kinase